MVDTWMNGYAPASNCMGVMDANYTGVTWVMAQKPAGVRVFRVYQMNCIAVLAIASAPRTVIQFRLYRGTASAGSSIGGLDLHNSDCTPMDTTNAALPIESTFGFGNIVSGDTTPSGYVPVSVLKKFCLQAGLLGSDEVTITSQFAWHTTIQFSKIFNAIDLNVQPLVVRSGQALIYEQGTAATGFTGNGNKMYFAHTIFTNEAS